MDFPVAPIIASMLAAFFGAPLAVLIRHRLNLPVVRERDRLERELRQQTGDFEKRLGEQKETYEERVRELKDAYTRILDGKVEQKQRKISYRLESVDQKIRDIRFCHESPDISILGINALGPLHQGREIIIDVLKTRGSVRVLLLDPTHEVFAQRSRVERDFVGRISAELLASIYILMDILHASGVEGAAELLEVGFHHEYPDRSLIMVNCGGENGLVLANPYPGKKGGSRDRFEPEEGKRGVQGEMFELVQRGGYIPGYRENVDYFRMLWDGDAEKNVEPARKVKLTIPDKELDIEEWPLYVRKLIR